MKIASRLTRNFSSNEKLAITVRAHLVELVTDHRAEATTRMRNWEATNAKIANSLVDSLLYLLKQAFLVPMNQEFFERAQRRAAALEGKRVSEVFYEEHPQLWVFTDFSIERPPDGSVPEGYEAVALLTNFEREHSSSLIQFFINVVDQAQAVREAPYIYGMKVESDDRITGWLANYAAVVKEIEARHGDDIKTVKRLLAEEDAKATSKLASFTGWKLVGWKD